MQRQIEILRFQRGERVAHPAPEAAVETPPPETPAEAGELLTVLVDLSLNLPHRSREIRAIVSGSYWRSAGSVVARLRRALADANRYLARANAQSVKEQRATGNLICATFWKDELFVGQVGRGHALVRHSDGFVESFPHQPRQLLPLGASLPPIIHVSYAPLEEGSLLFLGTTELVESLALHPAALLRRSDLAGGATDLVAALTAKGVTGTGVVIGTQTEPVVLPTPSHKRSFPSFRRREAAPAVSREEAATAKPEPEPQPVFESRPPAVRPPVSEPEVALRDVEVAGEAVPEPEKHPAPVPESGEEQELPEFLQPPSAAVEVEEPEEGAEPRRQLPQIRLPELRVPKVRVPELRLPRLRRPEGEGVRAPQVPVKAIIRTLLPGRVEGERAQRARQVPEERTPVMAGLALGLLLFVFFITLTMSQQLGGASREQELLQQAQEVSLEARRTQDREDWQEVEVLAQQILALNDQNPEARRMMEESRVALDDLDQATLLTASPIVELTTSPTPRRVLVVQSWLYVLNPATSEVYGIPLAENGIQPASAAYTPILRQGQTISGISVGSLVDMAWMEPGPGYPDGAIFIYSDDGYVYIYEPSLGPVSITYQRLQGELEPGNVTLIGTYGTQLYLIDRYANQIWKYVPVNGIYDTPPRPYFAEEMAPPLQTALDLALDGRLYLLFGDSEVVAYFNGTPDLSFEIRGLRDDRFRALVMALEPDPESGQIYLGDRDAERIVVLNKRGEFQRQFRLSEIAGGSLKNLETLTVGEDVEILYFVASNRLYAAPIPGAAEP